MRIESLSFKFEPQQSYFFHGLSADFEPYQVHFIQGDNGIGKSTLFNVLQGRTDDHSICELRVMLEGVHYTTQHNIVPYAFTQLVHTVQQRYDRMIADRFSFIENVRMANMSRYPGLGKLPAATIYSITQLMDIDINKPAYLLSGGQRQLLAIVMALQKPTKVLLLDEPTATLDSTNTHLIMQCLQELAAQLKVTMLVICHDVAVVEKHAGSRNRFVLQKEADGRRILALVK